MKRLQKLFFIAILVLTSLVALFSFTKTSNKVNAGATLAEGQTLDTNVKVISISDLTFNGKSNQNELAGNKNTDVTFADFDSSNPNKNLIFVFKYDLKDNSHGTDDSKKNLRVYMDVTDNKTDKNCSFMIRPDKIFLYNLGTSKWNEHATLAQGKIYNVEFGRIAILNQEGAATGKYYVYYKIDGVEYDSVISTFDVSKMGNTMYINIGDQHSAENRILDAYGKEDAKYVDISEISNSPITIAASKNQTFTFDNTDHKANYSLAFRFKYTFNEANQNQIHINGKDNWGKASSFTLGNNSGTIVRLGVTNDDGTDKEWTNFDYALTTGQTYDIEYGRVANVCGSYLLGTYECYLKIDGVIIATTNCVLDQDTISGNKIFITADAANTFTDCAPVDVIENPDIISIGDLKLNNELVGNTTVMNNKKSYSYDATAAHKSLIFKTKYEVTELLTGTNEYLKLFFSSSATSNPIRIRADKTYIKKDISGYAEGPVAFTEIGTYELEFGKIYIIEGKHAGTYHLYVKVNGVLIDEYYTNNSFANNNLFDDVANATQTWSDICINGHTLGTQVASQPSTCSTHGTLAYYECEACLKKFSDQACTQKLDSIVAPLEEHIIVNGECSVCHAKSMPEFTASNDGTKVMFTNAIELWKYSNAKVSFYSTYSTVLIDLVSPNKADRVSEKKTLTGTEVIGLTGVYYHYEFNIKDFALNSATGYETLESWRFRDIADYANVTVINDSRLLEVADDISVNDLFYTDGKACGKVVTFDTKKKFQWISNNDYASVIFSYKYTVNEIPSVKDYSFGQFHFKDDYSGNSLWVRNDKTYIKKDDGKYVEGIKVFTEPDTKTITFGKIYILSGDLAGKYYLFIRADGITLAEYVTDNDYNNTSMFCTLEDGTQWTDVDYVPNEYEVADEITVGDLYLNGKEMPNFITLDTEKEYTYIATATHKSVILKFKMTVDAIPEKSDYDYGQYYFDSLWGNNCLWIRNDKTYISKDNGGYNEGAKAFTEPGTKIIEIGKVYVTFGEDAGKYRLYVKAGDQLLVEYYSSNELTSLKVSTTGVDKRTITSPNYKECTDTHTLKHYDAVTPSCEIVGSIEYNWCKNCDKYYKANGTEEITDPSTIVLPMTHVWGDLVKGTPATCKEDGTYSYYECSLCHSKYKEDKTTKLETLVETAHHDLTHNVAALATCTEDGNIEYYYCSKCKKFFLDEACTQETTEDVTIAAHHTLGSLIDAIAETCATDGNVAYYHCSECGMNFADEECKQVIENVIINKHHSYVLVKGNEATCMADGNIEYYECSVCHKAVDNEGGSIISITIPKYAHTLTKVDAKAATCTIDGNVEYYHCSTCNKNYKDEAGTEEIANIVVAKCHKLTKVEAKDATCKAEGNIAYYHCSECNKNYSDAEGKNEVGDVTVPTIAHKYGDDHKCAACGQEDPNYKASTQKGCGSSIAVSGLITIACVAYALLIKRRKENF